MEYPHVLAFAGVAAALIVAPGPDVLLVLRNTLTRGRRGGALTAGGTLTGLLVHAAAATLGLSALLLASATAFTVVKLVGAGYLVLLGIQALLSARRARAAEPYSTQPGTDEGSATGGRSYRQGVLTNVLNPKVAVFFIALLPQFVTPGPKAPLHTALLGAVFWGMTLGFLALLVTVATTARRVLQRGVVRRAMDRIAGAVFIGLGVRLAFEQR